MRVHRDGLLSTCLFAISVVCVAGAQTSGSNRIVAEIGSRRISAADVERRLAVDRHRDAAAGRLDSFTSAVKARALESLIETTQLAAAARAQKLDARPDVALAIQDAVDQILADALLTDRRRSIQAGDDTLHEYYRRHPEQFEVAGRVRARHIVVRSNSEAVAIAGSLRRGADFARVAAERNVDSTRDRAGDLGWVRRGVMVEPFESVLFGLKVGEISPIVQTSFGFHIVQLQEIEPASPRPFDAVRDDVRQRVIEQELRAFKADVARRYPAKVHEQILNSAR